MVNSNSDPLAGVSGDTVLAIICGSDRIGQLLQPLGGYPVLNYSMAAAIQSHQVGKILVTGGLKLVEAARETAACLEFPIDKVAPLALPLSSLSCKSIKGFLLGAGRQHLVDLAGDAYKTVVFLDPAWPLHPNGALNSAIKLFNSHQSQARITSATQIASADKWWTQSADGKLEPWTIPADQQLYAQSGHFDIAAVSLAAAPVKSQPFVLDSRYDLNTADSFIHERAEWVVKYSGLDLVFPGRNRRSLPDHVVMLVMDFDGVLSDNKVWVNEEGQEMIAANRSDSLGMVILRRAGIEPMVLSMETNPVVSARCRKMNVPVLQGINDKAPILAQYLAEKSIDPSRVVYIGNDVNDLPCFPLVGYAVAVADAHPAVIRQADLVLSRAGGHAAVRELCDLLASRTAV